MTNAPLENTDVSLNLDERSIFEILKSKRLELNIDIAEAAAYLKIKPTSLEAIEKSLLDDIPKSLYVTGIIRSYSKMLKIDQALLESKVKSLPIESNTSHKKYKLINIGDNLDLKPNREQFFNFLIFSSLLFLILLFFFNRNENNNRLINTQNLAEELSNVN